MPSQSAKSESKTEKNEKPEDRLVYPVEFKGYNHTDDVSGQRVFIASENINGIRWQSHDIQDMRRYKRELERNPKAQKAKIHPTKSKQYFYDEAEAKVYEGLPGFVVHKPIKRSEAPDGQPGPAQLRVQKGLMRQIPAPVPRDTTKATLLEPVSRDTKGREMRDNPSGGDDELIAPDGPTTTGLADTSSPTLPPEEAKLEGLTPEEVREIEGTPQRGVGERIPTRKGEGVTKAQEEDMPEDDEEEIDTGRDVGKADASNKKTKGKKK